MHGFIRHHRWWVHLLSMEHHTFVDWHGTNHTELLVDVVDVVLEGSGIDENLR
jgi:hypothetical protein